MLWQEPTPPLGLLCCRASTWGMGWRPWATLQSIPCTEEPQHSGIQGPPSKAAEPLQGHQGHRAMPFGRWQKLPGGRRKSGSAAKPETENIFSELEKGRSVLFCLEAADGPNIPVLPDRFVGHTPSRAQRGSVDPCLRKNETELMQCVAHSFCGFSDPLEFPLGPWILNKNHSQ